MAQDEEEIVDPFASEPEERDRALANRLESLSGARIAVFSNTKKNADHFLRGVGEHLEAHYDVEVSDVVYKDVATSGADEEVYDRLREYDGVLLAYGDCGSCSSWTMYDAFQLEDSGIPTAVFCSEEFTTLCQFEAENQGVPGLPIVEFGHPIADLDPDTVVDERVTDEVVERTVEALTTPAEELPEIYEGRYTGESGVASD